MTEFTIQNAKEEDLLTYSDFFAQSPLFNTLNSPPHPQVVDHNFISRMAARFVEKLVFYNHQPVFYLAYRKSTFIHSIETMIYDQRVQLNQADLIEFIQTECLHKPGLKQFLGKFDYYTCDTALNGEFLQKLGFERIKNHRIMNLLLDRYDVENTAQFSEEILINPVLSSQDIANRVIVQNKVFYNKSRIPLHLFDVQNEMRNKSYIPDLALLLTLDNQPVGYGQIISNGTTNFLVNFGIIPEFQGGGLAHLLLEDLLYRSKEKKITGINLEVYEDNFKAVSLYEKHGFKTLYNKSYWSLG